VHVLWQLVALNLAVLLGVVLGLHVLFTLAVGPLSRGLVTHKFACAYDDMFRYVAAHTPSNGTAYFMMNHETAEPIENTRIGLRVLYDRPDVFCLFPRGRNEFGEGGLVAVTRLRDFSFNYSRLPVHATASGRFARWSRHDQRFVLVTSFVYRTAVFYVHNEYNVPQYKAWWGIPAFWALKRGVYDFGWNIYALTGGVAIARTAAALKPCDEDLVRDGRFANSWQCWEALAAGMTQAVTFVAADAPGAATAVRLDYQRGPRLHVRQHVAVTANGVYRLSGMAKMIAPAYPEVLGLRVAVYMPEQREAGVTWEYVRPNEWEVRQVVFTNAMGGDAVVYIELGGHGARDVLVTDVRLERIVK
jgi:hypothetical protein